MAYPATIERLIQELVKLPGIGRRSAERVVFHFLNSPSKEDISLLAQRLLELKERVRLCQRCHNLSEQDECTICMNETRNKSILCVVERPNDVTSIEKTGTFNGVYHVLLGSIAPLDGKGPAELKIDSLMQRIKNEHIEEVIIATDSDTEGETTALYLSKLIKPLEVRLS
ncbi:MAG TPA: recombination protein RecR, partial [Candidatus Omnitrophica bacterium]|nr:recombination protein RecR [Candidatus Omnitrophota bacterium]